MRTAYRSALLVILFVAATWAATTPQASPYPPLPAAFNFPSFERLDLHGHFYVEVNADIPVGRNVLQIVDYNVDVDDEDVRLGASWFKQKVHVESFTTTFTVNISNFSPTERGNPDGFAFVIQNHKASAFGPGEGGLAYGDADGTEDGIHKSVAIEFDTYKDDALGDPDVPHVGVHKKSLEANSAFEAYTVSPGAVTIPSLAGQATTFTIKYLNRQLDVFSGDSSTPFLSVPDFNLADSVALTSQGAWIGFTASTKGAGENFEILNWSYQYLSIFNTSQTYSYGAGKTGAVAGAIGTFTIQSVDFNGYNYTSGGQPINVAFTPVNLVNYNQPTRSVVDRANGLYTVAYNLTTVGEYDVAVTVNNEHISGSPFRIRITPGAVDPKSSDVSGATNGGVAGETLSLYIQTKDAYGNSVPTNDAGNTFTAKFSNNLSFSSTYAGNGTHLINYSLTQSGTYTLNVLLGDKALKGSPFTAKITPSVPDAFATYAVGNATAGGYAGTALKFSVYVRDRFNNSIVTPLSSPYGLSATFADSRWQATVQPVLDSSNNLVSYDVSYSITAAGSYPLSVKLAPNAVDVHGSPFYVTITAYPQPTASKSTAYGSGLTTASAGSVSTFYVQIRDPYGNELSKADVEVTLTTSDSDGAALPVTTEVHKNTTDQGKWVLSYTPTIAQVHLLNVKMNGQPISGSPFSVQVVPGPVDPKYTTSDGLGLVSAKLNVEQQFIVTTHDKFNNRLTKGGAALSVSITDVNTGHTVATTIVDMGNGAYTVKYTIDKAGTYQMNIMIAGQHTKDSPYNFVVKRTGLSTGAWIGIAIGVIAAIAIIGGGAYWYFVVRPRTQYDEIGSV